MGTMETPRAENGSGEGFERNSETAQFNRDWVTSPVQLGLRHGDAISHCPSGPAGQRVAFYRPF